MKVRIGNDICLDVALLGSKDDYINIKSIQAYLINSQTETNVVKEEPKYVQYVGRFPIELGVPAYESTEYDLCQCGHPTFHVRPLQSITPVYAGFSVYPHTFDGMCRCAFNPYCNHLWQWNKPQCGCNCANKIEDDKEYPFGKDAYLAKVYATKYTNRVKVYFPAEDQKKTGVYNLVLVAKIYEPGYASNNLKTITMDYSNVFTIVGTSDEADVNGGVELSVGGVIDATSVQVTGDRMIGFGKIGKLKAVVMPVNIDNDGVNWQLLPNATDKFSIISTTDTSCVILGTNNLDQSGNYSGTLRVSSRKTPTVYTDVTLWLKNVDSSDKYVLSGEYTQEQGGTQNIALTMSTGDTVNIDTTNETVWREVND